MSTSLKFRWTTRAGAEAAQNRCRSGYQPHSPEAYAEAAARQCQVLYGADRSNWSEWALMVSLPSTWCHTFGYAGE